MYFITTKRMLELCFSAHPNIQYRTKVQNVIASGIGGGQSPFLNTTGRPRSLGRLFMQHAAGAACGQNLFSPPRLSRRPLSYTVQTLN